MIQGCISLLTGWSMAAILHGSVVVVVVRTRPRATVSHDNRQKINSWVSFAFLYGYEAPLGGPWGRRSSAITIEHYGNKSCIIIPSAHVRSAGR